MVDQMIALVISFIVVASVLFDWWYHSFLLSKRLPPGPRPWPFLGSFLELRRLGGDPLNAALKLEPKYGKLITFWLGRRPLIVFNDPELAHQALVKQGSFFADRCDLSSFEVYSCGFRSVNQSRGAYWRLVRKNLTSEMLSTSRLKASKPVRALVIEGMVSQIEKESLAKNGATSVDILSLTRRSMFTYACYTCFGVNVDQSLVAKLDTNMAERMATISKGRFLGDFIPSLRLVESKIRQRITQLGMETNQLLAPVIQNIRELRKIGQSIPGMYTTVLLNLQEKEGRDVLSDDVIGTLCVELIQASTHTISATISTAIAVLSKKQQIQARIYQEIVSLVGNKLVDENDVGHLPYLQAVAKEVLRMYPPAPVIPHAVTEPCKLGGFDIPTNAVLLFNLKSFHYDSEMWSDPWDFNPERFLDMKVNVSGGTKIKFMPFGAGRRICPGLDLGLTNVFLVVARLVQSFEWSDNVTTPSEISSEENFRKPAPATPIYREDSELQRNRLINLKPMALGPIIARLRESQVQTSHMDLAAKTCMTEPSAARG